jgi:glycosyltransferase involved in cell wall biosynthesis
MKIDAITVSIDYSDYLEQIVGNKDKFDRWLIVTHESDVKAIEVCKKYNLDYILSKEIYANGACFSKSRAINEGIRHLCPQDWVCVLDSDILLPDNFNEVICAEVSDKNLIYGCTRYNQARLLQTECEHDYYIWKGSCWPAGFFQMWHISKVCDYYVGDITNAEGDIQQKNRFDDYKMLPMEALDVQQEFDWKANWYGRGIIGKTRHRLHKSK